MAGRSKVEKECGDEDLRPDEGGASEGSPTAETAAAEGQTEEPAAREIDPLEEARKEAADYKDRWMRAVAEFENYKKRTARGFETVRRSATEEIVRALLPVLDSVDRALAHGGKGQDEEEGFREGIKMIMEQLPKLLHDRGLAEIEAVGKPFDPNVHEALMEVGSEAFDAGVVVEVAQKGYWLDERVIRAAKVVVSRGKTEPTETEASGKLE